MKNFDELLKKYADFIVRVGVNPQPGQTLIINCCLEAAPLARLCVRSAYEAGARDVLVNWSDNDVSRSRMELGSEEALSDFKSWQLRRYLDYAESEGGVCVLHIHADDPEVYAGLDGAKISRVNAAQRKFMAPWREYTMNDRVQWSIAAMPSAPWAKKMFPELDEAAAVEKLWKLIFDVCRVTNGDPVNEWKAHLDRLTDLLSEDAKYATIYERILGLTAQDAGASMPTINEAVDNDELLKSPRLYAPHFIDKLEHGLDEEVRERGNNFSAGQRQLLSFARTILHKPSVMILDEATANIDTETELLIQDSLEKMRSVGTMLIVAHRLSTIQHADNILSLIHI